LRGKIIVWLLIPASVEPPARQTQRQSSEIVALASSKEKYAGLDGSRTWIYSMPSPNINRHSLYTYTNKHIIKQSLCDSELMLEMLIMSSVYEFSVSAGILYTTSDTCDVISSLHNGDTCSVPVAAQPTHEKEFFCKWTSTKISTACLTLVRSLLCRFDRS